MLSLNKIHMLASATTYLMARSTDNSSVKLILPSFQRRIFSSNLLHKATLKEQRGAAISYRQRRKGNKSLTTLRPHWGRKSVIWVQAAELVSGSWKSPKLFSNHRGSGPQIKTLSRFNPQQRHHTDPSAGSSRASGTTSSPLHIPQLGNNCAESSWADKPGHPLTKPLIKGEKEKREEQQQDSQWRQMSLD